MNKREEGIKTGCEECPKNEGMCMWGGFVGDCPQNSEARKKPELTEGPRFPGDDNGEEPEPTEFTRKCRGRIKRDSILVNDTRNMNMSMFRVISIEALNHLGKACDIIDHQVKEIKSLEDKLNENNS